MTIAKKAKQRVKQERWSTQMDCKVEIIKRGHFPDTAMVLLPDGRTVETDMAYLADLKRA